jgi:hypothetical protein
LATASNKLTNAIFPRASHKFKKAEQRMGHLNPNLSAVPSPWGWGSNQPVYSHRSSQTARPASAPTGPATTVPWGWPGNEPLKRAAPTQGSAAGATHSVRQAIKQTDPFPTNHQQHETLVRWKRDQEHRDHDMRRVVRSVFHGGAGAAKPWGW